MGENAVKTMSFSSAYVRSASSGRHGCSSTWFVASTTLTRGSAASCFRRGTPKFDPAERLHYLCTRREHKSEGRRKRGGRTGGE
jgi:hypothetical protein